jgi:hypothetical protein
MRRAANALRPRARRGTPIARLAANAFRRIPMARCEQCGNEYDKAFEVVIGGKSHTFDSFECAISVLAPVCGHCRCRIIGHGVEARGRIYCCAHCAGEAGVGQLRDRAE